MKEGRCPKHLIGAAVAFERDGRAGAMPLRFQAAYELASKDPRLSDLSRDLATLEVRVQELLSRLDTGETGSAWLAAGTLVERALDAVGERDEQKLQRALAGLQEVCDPKIESEGAWSEIMDVIDLRQKTVGSLARARATSANSVPLEAVQSLIVAVVWAIHSADAGLSAEQRSMLSSRVTEIGSSIEVIDAREKMKELKK